MHRPLSEVQVFRSEPEMNTLSNQKRTLDSFFPLSFHHRSYLAPLQEQLQQVRRKPQREENFASFDGMNP